MNKRILLAFLISFLILVIYPYYIKVISPPEQAQEEYSMTTSEKIEEIENEAALINNENMIAEERQYELENALLKVVFTNRGGAILALQLKEYDENGQDEHLHLFDSSTVKEAEDSLIGLVRIASTSGRFDDSFNSLIYKVIECDKTNSFIMESPEINGLIVRKTFILDEKDYSLKLIISVKSVDKEEKQIKTEVSSGLTYELADRYAKHFIGAVVKSYDKCITVKLNKIIKEGFSIENSVHWLTIENKYFGIIASPLYETSSGRIKHVSENIIIGYMVSGEVNISPNRSIEQELLFYAGPKEYSRLKSFGNDFELVIARGFWGSLRLYLLLVLNFFFRVFKNYGFAIIALTVIIKILFAPLTHKGFESMRKMQELQPQMKALQEKYKDKPQELNREIMELYKRHKANPFGGCFPLLLQMPIFIALYHTLSRSIELRGAPFIWWIKDLSEPDRMFSLPFNLPIIGDGFNLLPLLMIFSMVLQQKLTPSAGATKEQERIMFIMPIVFGVIFYNLPSGLVLYWFVNNLLTIAQQVMIKRKK